MFKVDGCSKYLITEYWLPHVLSTLPTEEAICRYSESVLRLRLKLRFSTPLYFFSLLAIRINGEMFHKSG